MISEIIKLKNNTYVVVVDDNSQDGTSAIIKKRRKASKYKKDDFLVELSGNYYKHDWYRFLITQPYEQPEQNDRKQYESYSIKLKEKNHLSLINGHYNF